MSSQTVPIKPKSLKVYYHDDFENLTTGLKIASCMISESRNIVDEQSVLKRLSALTLNGATDGNSCSCCGIGPFESRQQQISHYKHHWHTHNLKRKLFGKTTLTLGQFNSRVDDGDDSSVSGSDSEGESNPNKPVTELFANATRHCKAFFTNKAGQVVCVYRCILHHKKEELSTDGDGSAWVERMTRLSLPGSQRWAVLMMSGGHFAGAIFSGETSVVHKTFHSYTTRRGQGQAQGTRDQHGNAPKSAGSNLRRYNQAKFLEHVQEIITGWTDDLNGCSLILYRAVGPINQGIIFGKSSPLRKEDMRVRQLPFPTRKPSYKEVQRIHETVASLEIYESLELFQKALLASQGKPSTKSGSDTSLEKAKKQKSPNKLDRAKSRERAPRPLPTTQMSSEDEGPCYIDSETPKDWIKTLSEQASNGNITNSRKDLLLDVNESSSEDENESVEMKEVKRKKKKDDKTAKKEESKPAKKEESKNVKEEVKKTPLKISTNIKKIWHAISKEQNTLETILERWEGDLSEACNTADPADGNTALHKAAIAESPDMVTKILNAGGDPCVRNHLLQTPYAATPHSDTRIAFRLFQGQFPARYNYGKSQIPGPLTPEMLEQEKERKAQQKRAKRQREKEKQLEKAKSNKFLQLDDKEKHVQEIITGWTDDLNGCSLILYRAVGPINQGIIFGKSSPLRKEDMRVRQLPFPTRKPSYKEVQRIHETVASLEIYESLELFQKALLASQGKPSTKSGSDTSLEKAKKQKSPNKLDRAKSRERAPRPLPTTQMSSEDEGPCYIDSETPKDWIKTLSEQASNGNITNSRKDLLLDVNESSSEDENESVEMKEVRRKKKKDDKAAKKEESKPAKKEESKNVKEEVKKPPLKISAYIKKIWHAISKEQNTLETILEKWEGDLSEACNTADPADGNTALHKAAIAESPDMVTKILNAGGDPCVRNHLLQTPYAATPHSDTRIAFRLFQGQFPARYNYGKSQIPGPLTPEMLEHEKERKAQQKRAKRQREKEKQLEKAKSNKFLQLDDKEKSKSEEKRCFVCASALPKTLFEYDNYQFCTIKCLQNHRNIRPLNMSV